MRDEDRAVIPVASVREWASFFEDQERRRVEWTDIGRDIQVSTVFLGLDHRYSGEGPPLVFETLVFGGPLDGEIRRCSTWAEAKMQHRTVCGMVREAKRA
jgi:hypothetical protein